MKTSTLLLTACLLACGLAADWPQWQGPNRDNISKDTGLLKSWPPGGPKLAWTFDQAGAGYSAPAVVGDRLYCLGAEDGKEIIYCVDVKTAKKVWSQEVGPQFNNAYGGGPRCTPTVDGDRIYAIGGQGNLVCVKTADGEKVWSKGLKQDLGGAMMSGWGYSESPLVDGDQIVCTPGGKKGAVAALDKKTGDVLWRSKDFTDDAAYSSLVISTAGGIRQYILMTKYNLAGVAAKDGKLLWHFERTSNTAAIPTPLVHGDYVYASSGYGAGCTLLKLTATDGKITADEVYSNKVMVNKHHGFVLLGGYIYGYSDGKGWTCQDFKSGKLVWQVKSADRGSVTYADGRLYCYHEKDGTVTLLDPSPDGYKEVSRFKVPKPSELPRPQRFPNDINRFAHPVVANGHLYLRDQELLFCYDVKAK